MAASQPRSGDASVEIRLRALLKDARVDEAALETVSNLGSGGFGVVTLCSVKGDSGLAAKLGPEARGRVAVKRFHAAVLQDPELCRLVCNEVELLLEIQHPHLVRGLGVGCSGDSTAATDKLLETFFVVQEFVRGMHLRKLLMAAMISPGRLVYRRRDALRWALQLASALAHMHGRTPRVMHRDIKLENVMLTGPDTASADVRLVDMGLAVRLPGYAIQEATAASPIPPARSQAEEGWNRSLGGSQPSMGGGGVSSALRSGFSSLMGSKRKSRPQSEAGSTRGSLFSTRSEGPQAVQRAATAIATLSARSKPPTASASGADLTSPTASAPMDVLAAPRFKFEPKLEAIAASPPIYAATTTAVIQPPSSTDSLQPPISAATTRCRSNLAKTSEVFVLELEDDERKDGSVQQLGPAATQLTPAVEDDTSMSGPTGTAAQGLAASAAEVELLPSPFARSGDLGPQPAVAPADAEVHISSPPRRSQPVQPPDADPSKRIVNSTPPDRAFERNATSPASRQLQPGAPVHDSPSPDVGPRQLLRNTTSIRSMRAAYVPVDAAEFMQRTSQSGQADGPPPPQPGDSSRNVVGAARGAPGVQPSPFGRVSDSSSSMVARIESGRGRGQRHGPPPLAATPTGLLSHPSEIPLTARAGLAAGGGDRLYDLTKATGSLMYMAPEVLVGQPYNQKADVFSWAVLVYELLHFTVLLCTVLAKVPRGQDEEAAIGEYAAAVAAGYRPPINDRLPVALVELLERCWARNPLERPSMDSIVATLKAVQASDLAELDALDKAMVGCCGGCTIA